MRKLVFGLLLGGISLGISSGGSALEASGKGFTEEELQSFRDRWRTAMETVRVAGMAVSVVKDDELILLETFGVRDTVRDLPVTPKTPFYIASVTKTYVAFALQILADEGKVDLDRTVKSYVPRFELADEEAAASITIRDLLCHRPGLNSFPTVLLDAYTGEITEDRYYHFLSESTPSGRVTYSNVHFTLAGRVIQAVTGKIWRDFLRDRIFDPSGMTRTTGYADTMYAFDDVAIPTFIDRSGEFQPCAVRKTDYTMHAAGGLGTSVEDLARWLRLNLNGGEIDGTRILSRERTLEMQKVHSQVGEPRGTERVRKGFGLGWFYGDFHGYRYFQHGGGYVGSAADVSFIPEANLGVAVVANTAELGSTLCDFVVTDIYRKILDVEGRDAWPGLRRSAGRRLRDMRRRLPSGENPVAEGGLSLSPELYVGEYRNEHYGTLRIRLKDGAFLASLGGMKVDLRTTGKDEFGLTSGVGSFSGGFLIEEESSRVTGVELRMRSAAVSFSRHEVGEESAVKR